MRSFPTAISLISLFTFINKYYMPEDGRSDFFFFFFFFFFLRVSHLSLFSHVLVTIFNLSRQAASNFQFWFLQPGDICLMRLLNAEHKNGIYPVNRDDQGLYLTISTCVWSLSTRVKRVLFLY